MCGQKFTVKSSSTEFNGVAFYSEEGIEKRNLLRDHASWKISADMLEPWEDEEFVLPEESIFDFLAGS